MGEDQNIEYKQAWRDEYLKWICGFANAQGGKIFIGIDDDGKVTGVEDYKKLMDEIPNKTANHLGLVVDVNLRRKARKHYLEIDVPVSSVPISYHGAYHYRTGSTKQELRGTSLQEFLLKKIGRTWDDLTVPGKATLADLDEKAITYFLQLALKSGRIPANADRYNTLELLENLELVNEVGELRNATLLLFGKRPMKYFLSCYFKIGRFGESNADLRFQDTVEGNIFEMVDKVMERLKEKYLVSPISYNGLHRIETLEYPEVGLREALLNAIVHKDYTDNSTIQLSVYDDKLILWNPGMLPFDITIDELKKKHPSRPRNRYIADIFFRAGYIESWGRGIEKMIEAFKKAGLPEPIFEELAGGLQVTLLKDIYTEEYLRKLDLSDRQIKAIIYTKEYKKISNKVYQQLFNVSRNTASNDLQQLVKAKLLISNEQKGAGSFYIIRGIAQ
ncbi:MAG TPA: ATP-binding protein [Puia sp.]|nr:ATP-binding protein [Puia sp.]